MAGKILAKLNTIRSKLILYAVILFLLLLYIVVSAVKGNADSLRSYNYYSGQYSVLGAFYENTEAACSYAGTYLYSGTRDVYENYEKQLAAARENIQYLKSSTTDENLQWRFSLLEKMLNTYDEHFRRFTSGTEYTAAEYEFFSRIPQHIQDTYMNYSRLLTEAMNKQSHAMAEELRAQIERTVVTVAFMAIISLLFVVIFTTTITQPIRKIVANIKRIKNGSYELSPVNSADRDLTVLNQAIEEMAVGVLGNIRHISEKAVLEKKLLETENKNLKMNELVIETELKVLQGQMNPHFLFNTLSLISKMAYLEGAGQTSELMEITAGLLRYSLEKSGNASDLFGEIECIRNYLEIQKKRFGKRVEFTLFVEENLTNIVMPGMVVQPLIENAVMHGVNDMTEDAYVLICFYRRQDKICIQIEDNGKGMNSDRLEALMTGELGSVIPDTKDNSIGILNVRKRLAMFFGSDCQFAIESSEHCGTSVTISILDGEERREQDEKQFTAD